MPYDPEFVQPMRNVMTEKGFTELKTSDEVGEYLKDDSGTVLIFVNSVCPVSSHARSALFACIESLENKPDRLATVFAGQDLEATERAREYFTGYPPSSPSVALLKDGQTVYMMDQPFIRMNDTEEVTAALKIELEKYCK